MSYEVQMHIVLSITKRAVYQYKGPINRSVTKRHVRDQCETLSFELVWEIYGSLKLQTWTTMPKKKSRILTDEKLFLLISTSEKRGANCSLVHYKVAASN